MAIFNGLFGKKGSKPEKGSSISVLSNEDIKDIVKSNEGMVDSPSGYIPQSDLLKELNELDEAVNEANGINSEANTGVISEVSSDDTSYDTSYESKLEESELEVYDKNFDNGVSNNPVDEPMGADEVASDKAPVTDEGTTDNAPKQAVTEKYGPDFFGKLYPFIADIDITDINCNGRDVWVNHVTNGRYKVTDIDYTEKDIAALAYRVSNTENVQFNVKSPVMDADLGDLRFHFTYNSFSVSGHSVSIRKTPIVARIKEETVTQGAVTQYMTDKTLELLKACVKARKNIVVCGLTGSGKTELVKFLMKFTKPYERIITIEDTSELHLYQIYKDKDIVELKTNDEIDYEGAIKSCMRMLPIWILLSEARGKEVKDLIKCISTGAKIITTLHTDNAKQIPSRILNMFEDNELSNDKVLNMIYDFIDIGIHVKVETEGKTNRYIDQVVYFDRSEAEGNKIYTLYRVKKVKGTSNYTYTHNTVPKKLANELENIDSWGVEE